jgi:formylmethanofuran dehydrogenase subunit E
MPDRELFDVMEVSVAIKPEDLPGRPMGRVACDSCGEHVQDKREVCQDGKVLCVPCARGGYYDVKISSERGVRSAESGKCVRRYAEK